MYLDSTVLDSRMFSMKYSHKISRFGFVGFNRNSLNSFSICDFLCEQHFFVVIVVVYAIVALCTAVKKNGPFPIVIIIYECENKSFFSVSVNVVKYTKVKIKNESSQCRCRMKMKAYKWYQSYIVNASVCALCPLCLYCTRSNTHIVFVE